MVPILVSATTSLANIYAGLLRPLLNKYQEEGRDLVGLLSLFVAILTLIIGTIIGVLGIIVAILAIVIPLVLRH